MIQKNITKIKEELDKIDEMIYKKEQLHNLDYKILEGVEKNLKDVMHSMKIYFINRGDYAYHG